MKLFPGKDVAVLLTSSYPRIETNLILIYCKIKSTLKKNEEVYFAVHNENLMLIDGSIIDFESDIHKTSFLVKENPNAELTCSCKKSFSLKDSIFDKI